MKLNNDLSKFTAKILYGKYNRNKILALIAAYMKSDYSGFVPKSVKLA